MSRRSIIALAVLLVLFLAMLQFIAQSSYNKCMTKKSHEQCKKVLDFAYGE